ncbi:transcriptional regulator, Fur family [[Clostridium] methylpentosum DSM 5476]|jgi:Fur family transcriptional regulator, peroxide stress response regulator|uniref:Transcriptional regulator, Fur family n=1 Tax=[Clostridium] methylpentosum DSM 5476 TaxID=537013 RepID=C0EEP4_9FIRM|nr:transcriptional regulator, Fur family [[Clostridium] methylpentosum DSM 5476]MDY3989476.1 transcriptional repressor [Massilioclostridium sp.]MEE1490426.1 transcriptional repressor [Massilioclostridium sp.]
MKYSKQREIILDFVKTNLVHPSANYVYANLKKEHPNLSLGTVYRNLNKLSEHGLIQKIEVADAPDRFDGNVTPHFHAICVKCGQMYDFELDGQMIDLKDSIRGKEISEVVACDFSVKCVCRNCAVRENS